MNERVVGACNDPQCPPFEARMLDIVFTLLVASPTLRELPC